MRIHTLDQLASLQATKNYVLGRLIAEERGLDDLFQTAAITSEFL